jgi:hypothetical protein
MGEQGTRRLLAIRTMLTRRRAVDFCRVATAQCPAVPRHGAPA